MHSEEQRKRVKKMEQALEKCRTPLNTPIYPQLGVLEGQEKKDQRNYSKKLFTEARNFLKLIKSRTDTSKKLNEL